MLSSPVTRLLEEIFSGREKDRKRVREDPEACLLCLLKSIKEELPEVSAMLYSTVEYSLDEEELEEAKRLLESELTPK